MVLKKLLQKSIHNEIKKNDPKKNKKSIVTKKIITEYEINPMYLERYADIMVNYALNKGKGLKKGQTVEIVMRESAKQFLPYLQEKIIKGGGNCLIRYLPHGISRQKFELSSDKQLEYYPENGVKGRLKDVDCTISIISEIDKEELKGINPKKIMKSQHWVKKYRNLINKKEQEGKYFWTLCLFGTQAMAKEAGLSLEEYWEEIIKACYLNIKNPVDKWKGIQSEIDRVIKALNKLKIESVRVEAKDTDLVVKLGENRTWLGGSGHNIPSFEVFISPDFRGTQGHIQFTEKLYRYGNIIENAYLEFKDGKVTKATATRGEDVFKEMIAQPGANLVGEFSLTDSRLSKITKFMGETLYDENVGGKNGNTHIAVGMAYKESYTGDSSKLKAKDWEKLGFNDSSVHTDIVSTSNRKVTATLKNGKEMIIYKNGKFTI